MRLPFSAMLGACLLAAPAHAAPVGAIKDFTVPAQFGDVAPLIKVQGVNPAFTPQHPGGGRRQGGQQPSVQRHGGGGGPQYNRGGGGGQRYGGGGYRGDRHHDRGDNGAGIAAGVIGGLLLGAIIANESQRGAVNDCARRYRSYDPRSQTFVGNDGRRYRCP